MTESSHAFIHQLHMKTLADVKRKMRLGTKWQCYHLIFNTDMGIRKVGQIRTNAVAFLKPDGKLSWLDWPKAKDIQVNDENTFTILDNGEPVLRYTFVES